VTPSADLETPDAPDSQGPEDSQDQAQENPYGENFRELPQQLVEAIRSAITDFQSQEKFARRREVRKDRRNRFYEAGYQHLAWNNGNGGNGGFTLLVPGAPVATQGGGSIQCPQYMDSYDIFRAFLWVWISIVTQNTPGVSFEPDDPSVSEDIDAAAAAESYAEAFDRQNDTQELQVQIARMLGVSGRVVSWTRTETDGQRFGYEPDGSPKRFQKTSIHGTLETKVPITAREFDQNFPYCFIYLDHDVRILKDRYDWIAQEIKPGTAALGENQYERNARLGMLSGSKSQSQAGDSLTHIGTEGNYFLRPAAFTGPLYDNAFDEAEEGDQNEDGSRFTVGDKLRQIFPEGVRAVFVGDVYAESFPESMDDHIDIQFPFPGDGMFRTAVMDPMVIVQDNFNDMCNWAREKFDTGAGSIWVNADDAEWEAMQNQKASPNALRQKKLPGPGTTMTDQFFAEPDPELPSTFVQFLELIYGPLPQFMLACPPALFGEQMPDQKTASGYFQARNQATGRLGLIYARMQRMFARIRYQAALAAAQEPSETKQIVIPGGKPGQNTVVDLEALSKGNFHCFPDEDSSFPESTQQKRATMQNFVTTIAPNPAALEMFLENPDNIATWVRLEGISEIKLAPEEARDKQVFEIEQLLKGSPVLPSEEELTSAQTVHASAAIAGQTLAPFVPPLPKSSVSIGPFDYHPFELAKCKEWLSSATRRKADAEPNLAPDPQLDPLCEKFGCTNYGVLNVILHAIEHQKALPPPMPPPMPAPHRAAQPGAPAESTTGGPPPAPAAPVAAPAI
jgi:hypothetical protein